MWRRAHVELLQAAVADQQHRENTLGTRVPPASPPVGHVELLQAVIQHLEEGLKRARKRAKEAAVLGGRLSRSLRGNDQREADYSTA